MVYQELLDFREILVYQDHREIRAYRGNPDIQDVVGLLEEPVVVEQTVVDFRDKREFQE